MKIYTPSNLNYNEVFDFFSTIDAYADFFDLTVDFSRLKFAYPFGSLLLSLKLKLLFQKRKECGHRTYISGFENNSVVSYLAHIGFFKHSKINIGKEPGEARGSFTYLPIHYITKTDLMRSVEDEAFIGNAVEEESKKLSTVILGTNQISINHPVVYCFREVIRNTFEHAEIDYCIISAQKWRGGKIEIALFDTGRGVRAALNEKYNFHDDYLALSEAIKPGVSRVDFNHHDVVK